MYIQLVYWLCPVNEAVQRMTDLQYPKAYKVCMVMEKPATKVEVPERPANNVQRENTEKLKIK